MWLRISKSPHTRLLGNGNTRWLDLRAAVNRILLQCTNLQCLSIWGRRANFDDLASILPPSSTLTHLTCCDMGCEGPIGFNLATAGLRFSQLETLTLVGQRMMTPHGLRGLTALRTLRLHACKIGPWFPVMLYRFPNLRVIDWQYNTIAHDGTVSTTLAQLFTHRRKELVSCTFLDRSSWWQRQPSMNTGLIDLGAFRSMRQLSITDSALRTLLVTPYCLVELIITFTESHPEFLMTRLSSRKTIFAMAQHLKQHIPRLKMFHSPSLRSVQLWDNNIERAQLRDWGIASYLLSPYLAAFQVDLAVNLTLGILFEWRFRVKFSRQRYWRRLLWIDVI